MKWGDVMPEKTAREIVDEAEKHGWSVEILLDEAVGWLAYERRDSEGFCDITPEDIERMAEAVRRDALAEL